METEIVNRDIENYLSSLLPEDDDIIQKMEEEGKRRQFPIVGPLVGRILEQLSRMVSASNIFELGSGFGYSAYWFLRGLSNNGTIVLTDGSSKNIEQGLKVLRPAFSNQKIIGEVGDALEIINRYPGPFDIIFNDIDKASYPEVIDMSLPKLRKGGLLISDNVLWFGSVLTHSEKPDVKGIQEYNQRIYQEKGLLTSILPIRDGVSISQKLF